MPITVIRVLFGLSCVVMGAIWGGALAEWITNADVNPLELNRWTFLGAVGGLVVSLGMIFAIRFITQELFERLFPVFIAIALAMMLGYFLARYIILILPEEYVNFHVFLTSTLVLIFGYGGITLGLTRASNWETLVSAVKKSAREMGNPKFIDTSVIIDGRIADIAETGFIEGTLIIPRFVLRELQTIADSQDMLRRAKGRRGLDIVKGLQDAQMKFDIRVVEDDPPDVQDVDGKLVVLARQYGGKIITNDFNLNKIAQIEGIDVLNINDLANALKPAVLPDEQIEVKIVKEGKESFQGVGYLDDGTMIVVDGARQYVGKTVLAVVTSVLQTAAGRMIFTKLHQVLP